MVNENRQVPTSVSQVGVPSASQTEMRKLEEVSQSSHQAAVAQSVQGDRRSARSMGSDDMRGQSRGSALVDAALVVGRIMSQWGRVANMNWVDQEYRR